ncbi:MAG: prepilin-type N-terminal cleavage/methylation domain-containing protein [bacterium]
MINSRSSGFTLIELMIVVAIIAIIAATAVPIMLASRQQAQIKSVISTLRNISSAEEAFYPKNWIYGDFITLQTNGFLDARFSANSVEMFGYTIEISLTNGGQGFTVVATPSFDGPTFTLTEDYAITES